MLLLADDELSDQQIADRVRVGAITVQRLRRRFAAAGLAAALFDRPHPGGPTKLDREQQALVLALNSDVPPNGAPRWTMQQLADTLIALGVVDEISSKTVGRVLKRAVGES